MTTPGGPPEGITRIAARLGALAWVSRQLFEIEGRWAASMGEPAAVAHLATHSRHHGWHATLWTEALPDSPALRAASLVEAPSTEWVAAMAVAAGADEAPDATKLAILYRGLVPRARSLVAELEDAIQGPGSPQISRVIGLVCPDLAADAHGGHRLLEATLGDDKAIEMAVSAMKTLDQAFLA